MSDKETKKFQEKAEKFAESYLSAIKKYSFLLEAEDKKDDPDFDAKEDSKKDEADKGDSKKAEKKEHTVGHDRSKLKPKAEKKDRPKEDKVAAYRQAVQKAVEDYRKRHPDASEEEIVAFAHSMSQQGPKPRVNKLAQKKKEAGRETSSEEVDVSSAPLSPEEAKAKSIESRKKRAEIDAAQRARRETEEGERQKLARGTDKTQPFPPGHEKHKTIKPEQTKQTVEDTFEKIKRAVRKFKIKNPEAGREEIRQFARSYRDLLNSDEKDTGTRKVNAPKSAEMARELVARKMRSMSGRKSKLGQKIGNKSTQEKLIPFLKNILVQYMSAKRQMAEQGVNRPINREGELLIHLVEREFKMSPYNPKDEGSKRAFDQAMADVFQNPTKVLPPPFLASSLRSYPEDTTENAVRTLVKKRSFGKTADLDSIVKQAGGNKKLLNKLMFQTKIKGEQNVSSNRIVNHLGDLELEDFAKLLSYYGKNPQEVHDSEKSYRTAETIAGAQGERGVTTGNLGADEDISMSSEHETDEGDEQDEKEIARLNRFMPGQEEFENPGKTAPKFDPGSLLKQTSDLESPVYKKVGEKVFDVAKAKNIFDNYFSNFKELEDVSAGDVEQTQKLNFASKFLEKILGGDDAKDDLGNQEFQKVAIQGLARQYALQLMTMQMKQDISDTYDKHPEARKKEVYEAALKKYTFSALGRMAKEKEGSVKAVLGQMIVRNATGALSLKKPDAVTWPNNIMKNAAKIVYQRLAPGQLTRIQGFDDFIVAKADSVQKRILDIVQAVGNTQLRQKQHQDVAARAKEPVSPEARLDAETKRRDIDRAKQFSSMGAKSQHAAAYAALAKEKPGTLALAQKYKKILKAVELQAPKLFGIVRHGAGSEAAIEAQSKIDQIIRQRLVGQKINPEQAKEATSRVAEFVRDFAAVEKPKRAETPAVLGINPAHSIRSGAIDPRGVKPTKAAEKEKRKELATKEKAGKVGGANFAIPTVQKRQEEKDMKKESLIQSVYDNLVFEGKTVNFNNIRTYLVSSVKNGTMSRQSLEEVLLDINGVKHTFENEAPWEEVGTKKKKKKACAEGFWAEHK